MPDHTIYADCNFYVGTEPIGDGNTRVYVYRLTLADEYALVYSYLITDCGP